jgi:hypothetical protein
MRLIMFLLAISVIFSNCHSGSSNGSADEISAPSKHTKVHNSKKENHEHSVSNDGSYSSSTTQPATTTTTQPETPQKKGWSSAAKGAVIGGATGAAAGAILDKNNRLVGGVVGAAIGTGAGYLIGRSRDRKTGRVVKHQSNY